MCMYNGIVRAIKAQSILFKLCLCTPVTVDNV